MITAPTEFSGLQVWLDASDTTTLFQLSGGTTAVAANLDPVGYWGDKSGNNRHFTNIGGSATTRPVFASALSSVWFRGDGINANPTYKHYLTSISSQTITSQTVFVVHAPIVRATYNKIFTQAPLGIEDATRYVPLVQTSNAGFGSNTTNFFSFDSIVSYRNSNIFDICVSRHTGTAVTNFVNGVAGASFSDSLGTLDIARQRLGASIHTDGNPSGSLTYLGGYISEVIVYNRALTNLERADVEYYLTRKWNFLNSIPRQVYGIKNGLWSLTDTWSVSAEPSPWNFPLEADNAYTNTFTITADSSTKVDTIRNSTLAPNINAGGSFVLANGVSLSANYGNSTSPITNTVLISSFVSTSAEIIGNVSGPQTAGSSCLRHSGTGIIYLSGSVFGVANNGNGANTIDNVSSGNINIVGNLFGGSTLGINSVVRNLSSGIVYIKGNAFNSLGYSPVILNASTGTVYLTGNVYGHTGGNGTGSGVSNTGTGTVEMIGDAYGNLDPGVRGTNGIIRIYGNCIGSNSISTTTAGGLTLTTTGQAVVYGNVIGTNASSGATSTITATSPLSVYRGNIINAPNGRQAIYAPRYQVFPTGSAQYTRQAANGYDSYVDYWTSNSTFSYPASSDVALGTTYSNSSLSGSMAVPSPSSVALGALVGSTTGTAAPLTIDNILNQPLSSLNTPNSIGARLKNITTSQALSSIANSLNFTN